jgi:septal ring factor EnvC (AmiA/AmiB activator)
MSKIKKLVSVGLVVIFSLSLLTATGCSRHPNEEQIQAMEEARSACLAAEQKLSDVQKERASLDSQLAAKKSELDKAQKEKANVEQGLANWNETN